MATIQYKCNICEREIELLEQTQGLTVFSKCIITNGCKGKLNKLKRNPDSKRESFPDPIGNLIDYIPRNAFHEHEQILQNNIWRITHNLKVVPLLQVYINDNNNLKFVKSDNYQIVVIDKNTIELRFPNVFSGIAQCISRSTVHEYNLSNKTVENQFQVTKNGLFVFAFPKFITHFTVPPIDPNIPLPINTETPSRPIRLEISLIQPNKEEVLCTELIPDIINNNTPWSGWNEILVRKRRNYNIKVKSIFDFKRTLQLDTINKNDIENGTQIRFLRVDYGTGVLQPIEQDDILLLISNSPHEPVDKIKNQIIDVGNVIFSKNDFFVYNDGEVFTSFNNLESTYPIIQRVNV